MLNVGDKLICKQKDSRKRNSAFAARSKRSKETL